ncbi:anaphase-promoting complex subunit 4-like isoform X2 [Ostrea edulis]|uniref:anaphase-promoting complex subunit 4-like isoform X2 n=1 Tax=Ostrea edulis TaxID=37623 RepID=UPI0024AEA87B|nr:anaphase-promoting complex subunit 4-like isoform X2 [Ostrea edulis]
MPEETSFRLMDEKHVSVEVEFMLWSPKFDLIALANVQGEVVLHRLSWQKVWSIPPPSEEVKVKALAWRPDGKVVAAGYSDGRINLYHIENADTLHSTSLEGEINCMEWVCQFSPDGAVWKPDPYKEDNFKDYLPKLQPLNRSYGTLSKVLPIEESVEDSKQLNEQRELNLLIVGSGSNTLSLFAYGVCPVSRLSVPAVNDVQIRRLHSAIISQDLHNLSLVVELQNIQQLTSFHLMSFDTKLIASRHKEMRMMALKFGQVLTMTEYLQSTVQQMSEAWEDILMEMDSKLLKFAEDKKAASTGTVSNDFLELLLFGTPSPELQTFLLNDLTGKGLQKLGHSIETSYSNIQKLVVKHLQVVSQAILYHLSELRGMSLWYEKFGVLGLTTQTIQNTIMAVGSFVLKSSELQQVIDDSIKNFKAFFRWLYVVIQRMSNEKPPADLIKMTQHDVNFVAEFLRDNFNHFTLDDEDSISELMVDRDKKPRFKLEKVGQYLKKEDLHYPPNISSNPWVQFQRGCFLLKDNEVLYPVQNTKSLLQLQETLDSSINTALHQPSTVIGQSMRCLSCVKLFERFTNNEKRMVYCAYTQAVLPCEMCILIRSCTASKERCAEAVAIRVGALSQREHNVSSLSEEEERCRRHKIIDIAFYDEKTMSMLLVQDNGEERPVLVQLPLATIAEDIYTVINQEAGVDEAKIKTLDVGDKLEPSCFRRLENMRAHSFAVSGTRKTATVLFSSRRRVRIFLMDAEEEDEDEGGEEEEEGDDPGDQSGELNSSEAHEREMQIDETEMDENKENTSFDNSAEREADISADREADISATFNEIV